ncbi:hypothetical protein B0H15DRAFT_1025925 [Mycena belliarum]|uniref:Uncharacterized protein n=1 Tax=Mycena belliarum TaxID=1033014 RepID=A0AAD6TSW1_9AGAR|nr:hypothetical protein B0H15DRAFT_1025925 [Mycena belliae]
MLALNDSPSSTPPAPSFHTTANAPLPASRPQGLQSSQPSPSGALRPRIRGSLASLTWHFACAPWASARTSTAARQHPVPMPPPPPAAALENTGPPLQGWYAPRPRARRSDSERRPMRDRTRPSPAAAAKTSRPRPQRSRPLRPSIWPAIRTGHARAARVAPSTVRGAPRSTSPVPSVSHLERATPRLPSCTLRTALGSIPASSAARALREAPAPRATCASSSPPHARRRRRRQDIPARIRPPRHPRAQHPPEALERVGPVRCRGSRGVPARLTHRARDPAERARRPVAPGSVPARQGVRPHERAVPYLRARPARAPTAASLNRLRGRHPPDALVAKTSTALRLAPSRAAAARQTPSSAYPYRDRTRGPLRPGLRLRDLDATRGPLRPGLRLRSLAASDGVPADQTHRPRKARVPAALLKRWLVGLDAIVRHMKGFLAEDGYGRV